MSVCCECCVLSGRGLCDGLITRPEESYRLWCVVVCNLETSWIRRPWPNGGLSRQKQTNVVPKHINISQTYVICSHLLFIISLRAAFRQRDSNTEPLTCQFAACSLPHQTL
jgi:hypothetical protein